ncbi:MAG: Ig-like domain-containing protein [Thermoplasmatota archaeon]
MNIKLLSLVTVVFLLLTMFTGCFGDPEPSNQIPVVMINHPKNNAIVSGFVMISGISSDPDGDQDIKYVEVRINDGAWKKADGAIQWSYHWNTYEHEDGKYNISVQAWDGQDYSDVKTINVKVNNPYHIDSDPHRWALFVAAANFPEDNETKLGNGGLYLAEEMAEYLIIERGYSTSNIFILFDDGWIRDNNGYGDKVMTLQQRTHKYAINYNSATKDMVELTIAHITEESNKYRESEVFLWFFSHGYGDMSDPLTGGKLLESSHIFLWDDIISDKKLGEWLSPLKSRRVAIIIDACFSGGFAEKTILNIPTSRLFRSGIPRAGRVVIAGASKFRVGYASTTKGPLFSLLWFEGLKTGNADGFGPGLFNRGRPRRLNIFKDGKVSVEEAFYYARYILSTEEYLEEYNTMEPQMTDRYPYPGLFFSRRGLVLGEN